MFSKVNRPFGLRIKLRSTIFSSSLTLPGHLYSIKGSIAPGASLGIAGSFNSLDFESIKCCNNAGISDFLSRRGGISIGKTLSRNHKSSRNLFFFTISSRSLLVAAIILISSGIVFSPPTRSISLLCKTFNNRTCACRGNSPISSK